MSDKAFSEDSSMLKCCLDIDIKLKECDKPTDNFLPTLKLVPFWFVIKNE